MIGTIEILEEQHYKEILWQTGDESYYQQGITDPDYCILRFITSSERIYQNFVSETFLVNSKIKATTLIVATSLYAKKIIS